MKAPARFPALAILALGLAWYAPSSAAEDFRDASTLLRITYEEPLLPGDEVMGLLGGGYALRAKGPWHVGFAAYGAARGERGGFFTGGVTLAWRRSLGDPFHLDVGLFGGGGGGGSAPQGGGTMIRPHAELSLQGEAGSFGVGWSRIVFPNGDIASNQISLGYSRPLHLAVRKGWGSREPVDATAIRAGVHFQPQFQALEAVALRYVPIAGTLDVDGDVNDESMNLLGAAWRRSLPHRWFVQLGAAGVAGGPGDGYAQVMIDVGNRVPLGPTTTLVLRGGPGLAGGGNVATGGGLVVQAGIGLEQVIGRGFHVRAEGGGIMAVDGDFAATTYTVAVGHVFQIPVPTGGWQVLGDPVYEVRDMRVRLMHRSEFAVDGATREDGRPDVDLGLIGLAGDVMVGDHVFLTGQALAAYDGGAGGYAEGLGGVGLRRRLIGGLEAELEVAMGAAGGGGVRVEGGPFLQVAGALVLRIDETYGLRAAYGRNGTPSSGLERGVLSLGLGIRFATLMR